MTVLFFFRTFRIGFKERRRMRTSPNWRNDWLFSCSRTESGPFLVVFKLNWVLGGVYFSLYGRIAGLRISFFRVRILKFALGRAIINNIESRNFGRHLEVSWEVFLGVFRCF